MFVIPLYSRHFTEPVDESSMFVHACVRCEEMPSQCVSGGVSDVAAVVKIVRTQYNNNILYMYDVYIHIMIYRYLYIPNIITVHLLKGTVCVWSESLRFVYTYILCIWFKVYTL